MGSISIVGLLLIVVVFALFLVEFCKFILSFEKGKRIGIPIHLLGTISSIFILIFTVSATFGYNVGSKSFSLVTVIFGTISFILLSLDSIIIEKSERRVRYRTASRSKRHRRYSRSLQEN